MGGPPVDCLGNPLGAVRVLFERACGAAASSADLTRSDWGVKELFGNCLYRDNGFMQVPEINSVQLDSIPVNSLVRFRGMVQDMFDVEYYVGAYKDQGAWHTVKYMDVADIPSRLEAEVQMWDRHLFYCVPVPGENLWVKEASCSENWRSPTVLASTPALGEKRPRQHPLGIEGAEDFGISRNWLQDVDADTSSLGDAIDSKRLRDGSTTAARTILDVVPYMDLNMPLNSGGEHKLVPCLVKVYDGADADLKLNDVVEFYGVFTFDPELSTGGFSQMVDSVNENDAVGSAFIEEHISIRLPASKVPRLQCITLRKLSQQDLLSSFASTQMAPEPLTMDPKAAQQARLSLLEGLRNVVGGDSLAAQYLLLHLLSQVHARVDSIPLGKLSLNMTGCHPGMPGSPSSLGVGIADTISKLLQRSHLMPLSIHSLNLASITPRKDYASNRLVTGALQLPEGTHLTLDETALEAGTLTSTGVQNLESLKCLLQWQKVEYDFHYHKMEMLTNLPVLVLSQATSRMLPADAIVPLRSTGPPSPLLADESDFAKWRVYLTVVRDMPHSLQAPIQQMVEDDLVAARQQDRSLGPETFHRWLTMARLMAASFFEPTLLPEHWHMVRDLERCCAERLNHSQSPLSS